ncbi:MAG: sugar O-acetyltransferase [Anaerolineales bacterium]|nr:sugar O-acetyltransferase [Anaerolineales bacterium]
MLAGEVYNCLDAELEAERHLAKARIRAFNSTAEADEQQAILQTLLGRMGQNVVVEPPFYCSYGCHIFIGDYSYLNFGCTILDNNEVQIGRHVMIGPAVQIYTAAHALLASARNRGLETAKKIVIKDNVWIGGGAIILPGVVIEENAVIGAGAVVTRNVAAHTVVAGNPARVIRNLSGEFSL